MYKVGIDVGGTFTDIVVQHADGRIGQGKVPSTPGNESEAVISALALMAEREGQILPDFLADVSVINFGTTVATNAMLQHKGVPTAMLTTRGFRDILELRRGHKEVLFDIRLKAPEQIVRRRWRLPITERIGAAGEPIKALCETDVLQAAEKIRKGGIRSVAICFMNSYLNDAHERRAAEILAEACPEVELHLSSAILPKIREFERFSTTVVNAFLGPLLRSYLDRLMVELRRNGFKNQLLVMQSNGGTVAPEQAGKLACAALLSGPAGGVAAAVRVGEVCGARNIIGVDMGGTSYDVSLIRGATPETRVESWFSRHFVGLPMLAIHTLGAGGGSIAWVDGGGALRVGPQSAGARPGPACYGLGGNLPTVTDAFLYLGYLNPSFFLGGRMRIDPKLAQSAIEKEVAAPLGMTLDEAAYGIFRVINNNLTNGIRFVSVAEGHDPRDFALMSFGGAGSLTAVLQARDLGIRRVLVPRSASVFCALGEMLADLRISQIHPTAGRVDSIDAEALAHDLDSLAMATSSALEQVDGIAGVRIERFAEMRYAGQVHELATPMLAHEGSMAEALAETVATFHRHHHQRYAFQLPSKTVEMLAIRQDVIGERHWDMPKAEHAPEGDALHAIKEYRRVGLPSADHLSWTDVPIYDGARIRPGNVFEGPAIIEEVDTTIVLLAGDRARLNEYQVYDITVAEETALV